MPRKNQVAMVTGRKSVKRWWLLVQVIEWEKTVRLLNTLPWSPGFLTYAMDLMPLWTPSLLNWSL